MLRGLTQEAGKLNLRESQHHIVHGRARSINITGDNQDEKKASASVIDRNENAIASLRALA